MRENEMTYRTDDMVLDNARRLMLPQNLRVKHLEHDDELTLDILEDALKTSAKIVKEHGDKFLPIFERMYNEVEKKKAQEVLKQKALELVSDN